MARLVVFLVLMLGLTGGAAASCKDEVDQAFSKLRGSKGFRLETTIVNEKQGTLRMMVDYQLPDRMHQRVSMGNSPAKMETIVIAEKVWSNQGQGWQEVPANFAAAISKQLKETVAEPSQSKLEYECLGEATLEGKPYLAYRATLPAAEEVRGTEPSGPANIQMLYVDKETGLPVRNIVTKGATETRLFDGTFSTPPDIAIKAPG